MWWSCFECINNFLEMFMFCFLALRVFKPEQNSKKDILWLLVFSIPGAMLTILREASILLIADYVPTIITVSLYSIICCKAKIWAAVLWAIINYFMLGIITIVTSMLVCVGRDVSMDVLLAQTEGRIMTIVLIRLVHLLMVEGIILIIRKFKKITTTSNNELVLVGSISFSIIVLRLLWNGAELRNEDILFIFYILIGSLFLVLNFGLLIFREIISKEQYNNKELTEQNRLISMQIRNQMEVNEMYSSMRALKHDMNNHLHSISGYLQVGEYQKASTYIQKITNEVINIEKSQSGNTTIDALLSSKENLAEKNHIRVTVEIDIPRELKIAPEHLTVILGNLYDNAIDANLKVEIVEERYILIKLLYRNDDLLIHFENAARETNKVHRSFWGTTKKNKYEHGYGIKNIDKTVHIYDGFCERSLQNNVFICSIRIPDKIL